MTAEQLNAIIRYIQNYAGYGPNDRPNLRQLAAVFDLKLDETTLQMREKEILPDGFPE